MAYSKKRLRSPVVGVLMGSRSDEPVLKKSKLLELLRDFGFDVGVSVISSDRNPDELRSYCLDNRERLNVVIALAGGVPNLPITVKSWLPNLPVICVPVDHNPDFALASLTTPKDRLIIVAGYGFSGLQKAAYIARDLLQQWDRK